MSVISGSQASDVYYDPYDFTIDSDPYVIIRPEGEWHAKGVLDGSSLRPVTSPLRNQKAA